MERGEASHHPLFFTDKRACLWRKMLFAAISALSLASAAAAQNVVSVQVGGTSSSSGGIFQFIPSTITASNGTVVNFQFSV